MATFDLIVILLLRMVGTLILDIFRILPLSMASMLLLTWSASCFFDKIGMYLEFDAPRMLCI